ncbi:subunit 17 of mediator complex-domain-containing protein [Gongronella butleri]|nr:subunit 17 of mediator complex-domain-containing protein [Gongronella butleri]
MSEPKRIKLSLEPAIDKTVVDITEAGHEIHKTDLTLDEQLMRNVDRIWFERGDWKDITEKGLKDALTTKTNVDAANAHNDHDNKHSDTDHQQQPQPQQHADASAADDTAESNVDLAKLRESVISKLYYAKCEIDVALDVINILVADNRSTGSGGASSSGGGLINSIIAGVGQVNGMNVDSSNAGSNNNLVLPPGTLHATYVAKPRTTDKAVLEQAQLTLGAKRKQQQAASQFLHNAASKLEHLVDEEQAFWDQAIKVRRNHWLMQASTITSTGESGFLVRYGFTDVGSDFGEVSYGEMLRSDRGDRAPVQLTLPHNIPKAIRVSVHPHHVDSADQTNDDDQHVPKSTFRAYTDQDDDTQQRLLDAQATVYDSELFTRILSEAQGIANNVQFEGDSLTIALGGQMDVKIQRVAVDTKQQGSNGHSTDADVPLGSLALTGKTIELALRLLLTQRHRFNLWKSRARLMTNRRETQQFLNNIGEGTASLSVAGTPSNTTSAGASAGGASGGAGGASSTAAAAAGSGAGTGTNTPILNPRAITAPGGGAAFTRQLSSSGSMQKGSSAPGVVGPAPLVVPLDVPLLDPVLSMTKFGVLLDRVRRTVHTVVDPLTGESGLPIRVHFKPQHRHCLHLDHQHDKNHTGPGHPSRYAQIYPSYGAMSVSLGINVLKGPSLRFALNQTDVITATVPGKTVALSTLSDFETFLLREIKLICLQIVCQVGNDMIEHIPEYQQAKGHERNSYLWQVDQVEEVLYGTVKANDGTWKNIEIHMAQTMLSNDMPAYLLQVKYSAAPDTEAHYLILSQWSSPAIKDSIDGVHFRDKVAILIRQVFAQ